MLERRVNEKINIYTRKMNHQLIKLNEYEEQKQA